MTENCYDLYIPSLPSVCRVCLSADSLRPMRTEEIYWYESNICKMAAPPECTLNICLICGYLLKKYLSFYNYCKHSQIILSQFVEQNVKSSFNDFKKPLHNFIQTNIQTNSYTASGQINDDTIKCVTQDDETAIDDDDDDNRDDDMPLVMLSRECVKENRVKKKRKKCKNDVELAKQEHDSVSSGVGGKVLKTGFSSRMVQETEEYIVIKLTREQVLEEMRERSASEKYLRALYKCAQCVQGFNFEDVLAAHMEKHSQEYGSFQCNMCQQYCPSAVSLRGHIKSHTTRYKCKICGEIRRGRQHLLEHHALTHTHADVQTYSCHHCQFTTNKRTVIQRHVRTHRAHSALACHECGRLFRTVETLRVHTTRHDKSRSLRCGECGRGFIYPSLLAKHERTVHKQTEYYCVECDVRFKSPENLRLHFKKAKRHRDSSSYTYECPQCAERFLSAASLAVHSTTAHGEPKKHPCGVCRRTYSSKESLRAHLRRAHKQHEDSA